ncbi:rod shape-determining protein [Acaryochloris sp. CCMEE 5410]|uniref:rod shape-determining protein n=1 Tax=Acaryochloris sp. CCMEE 5410 TaxID=310037 RepID=UPI000248423A|nr:rod shape-determining protein [Acaryochloris sp. CCMEE 5410]
MNYALSPPDKWFTTTPQPLFDSWWKTLKALRPLNNALGIDLGTSNTLIYSHIEGVVLNEASIIAINQLTQTPVSVGNTARQLLGRTSTPVAVLRPVRNGVIADLKLTQIMLQSFIRKAQQGTRIFRPRLVLGCSCGATSVEREALTEAALEAGARDVVLIDEPIAAALGIGLPITKPKGNLIIDIGGGTTEMAVICSSHVIDSQVISIAGDSFNQAIVDYLRQTFQVHIGELTAESLKIQFGSASDSACNDTPMEILGVNVGSGLPQRLEINSGELRDAISIPLHKISVALLNFLERTHPELVSDIAERGIMVTGGGALLSGIDTFFQDLTHLPVHISPNPLNSVVLGTGKILEYEHQSSYSFA